MLEHEDPDDPYWDQICERYDEWEQEIDYPKIAEREEKRMAWHAKVNGICQYVKVEQTGEVIDCGLMDGTNWADSSYNWSGHDQGSTVCKVDNRPARQERFVATRAAKGARLALTMAIGHYHYDHLSRSHKRKINLVSPSIYSDTGCMEQYSMKRQVVYSLLDIQIEQLAFTLERLMTKSYSGILLTLAELQQVTADT